MSDEKKEKTGKKDKPKKEGKKGGGKIKLLILLLIIAGGAVPALGLVVLAGMIPTLAMGLTDRSNGRSLTVCVATLNAAGVFQVVLMLLARGLSLENSIGLLMRPETFLMMWGAAALGFGLFSFIPPLVASFLMRLSEIKIARLRSNQKELKRIWGDEVG